MLVQALRRAPGRVLPTVAALSLGALVLLPGGLHVETGVAAIDHLLTQPRMRVDFTATSPAVDAVHRVMTEPYRAVGLGIILRAGSQALYGLEGLGGPDALLIPPYEELVDAAQIDRPDGPFAAGGWLTLVSVASFDRLAPLLDLLNVGFVLAHPDAVLPGLVDIPLQGHDQLKALRRTTAWPRAFFVDGVTTYSYPADLLAQVASHGSPLAAIQSSDTRALGSTRALRNPSTNVVPAEDYRLTTNATSFVLHAPGQGVAVLTETYLPDDFRATLNGLTHPLLSCESRLQGGEDPLGG